MGALVLGGGVAGLAAALYLRQLRPGLPVTLLEAAAAPGGWVSSTRHGDGALYEHGPRTVRPAGQQGVNTLQLVELLGLQNKVRVIRRGHPATLNRMVRAHGRLHRLPSSVWSMLRPLQPFGRPLALSALTDLSSPAPPALPDDSMYAFAARRFGERVAQYAVDPLVRGVCAGDARQISVRFLMERPFELEQRHGGVLRGLWRERGTAVPVDAGDSALARRQQQEQWAVWSLDGGLQTLPEAMADWLERNDVSVVTGAAVRRLKLDTDGVTAETEHGRYTARHAVSALPAHVMSALLDELPLSGLLADIQSATVGVINLEFAGDVLPGPPGFGYLIPSCEPSDGVLGVIFDTWSFPQGDRTVVTVMSGGAELDRCYGPAPTEQRLLDAALTELRDTLGLRAAPTRVCVQLLDRCIPQYRVGHKALVRQVRGEVERLQWPLLLAGAPYDGVSVNDCVLSGRRAAEAVSCAVGGD